MLIVYFLSYNQLFLVKKIQYLFTIKRPFDLKSPTALQSLCKNQTKPKILVGWKVILINIFLLIPWNVLCFNPAIKRVPPPSHKEEERLVGTLFQIIYLLSRPAVVLEAEMLGLLFNGAHLLFLPYFSHIPSRGCVLLKTLLINVVMLFKKLRKDLAFNIILNISFSRELNSKIFYRLMN